MKKKKLYLKLDNFHLTIFISQSSTNFAFEFFKLQKITISWASLHFGLDFCFLALSYSPGGISMFLCVWVWYELNGAHYVHFSLTVASIYGYIIPYTCFTEMYVCVYVDLYGKYPVRFLTFHLTWVSHVSEGWITTWGH